MSGIGRGISPFIKGKVKSSGITPIPPAYGFRLLTADTGFVWRDGNQLVGNCPPDEDLVNFEGWNSTEFYPETSTLEVLKSTNGDSWSVAEYSPSEVDPPRHYIGHGKRADGKVWFWGSDYQHNAYAGQVWTFDGVNYDLITSSSGLENIFSFAWRVHKNYMYAVGGQSSFDGSATANLTVYRAGDDGIFHAMGNFPSGWYTSGILYSNGIDLFFLSGAKYGEPANNYNDKILRSTDDGLTWTQIGTLPENMLSIYSNGEYCYNKFWFILGSTNTEANNQGVWYTNNFQTWKPMTGDLPPAAHARGTTIHFDELYGAFGNSQNNCWKIIEINYPTYLNPLLYEWWGWLTVKPSQSLVENYLNPFVESLSTVWNDIDYLLLARGMETEEQALRPLKTTKNVSAINNGVTWSVNGFQGGDPNTFVNLKFGMRDCVAGSKDDVAFGCYLFTDNVSEYSCDIGVASGAYITHVDSGLMYTDVNSTAQTTTAEANTLGYRAVVRTSSTGGYVVIDNTNYPFTSTSAPDAAAFDMFGCAQSSNGTSAVVPSSRMNGFWFVCNSAAEGLIRTAIKNLFT